MLNLNKEKILQQLTKVLDPELQISIVELGMVKEITFLNKTEITVTIALTIPNCPLRNTIKENVTNCLKNFKQITKININLTTMTPTERKTLQTKLQKNHKTISEIFAETNIYAIASGKGGVGKSTITVNLAAALTKNGKKVGIIDADIHGFSIPNMLNITTPPTRIENMILPAQKYGIKVISMGMFTKNNEPIMWRGPILHRALEQFLQEVYFGQLDILLLDLPPGTGDIAISIAQLLPQAKLLLITTPQTTASEVAQRAGAVVLKTKQTIFGVIENMSWLTLENGQKLEIFGTGGGEKLTNNLNKQLAPQKISLLGKIPLETQLRIGADEGKPLILSNPENPSAKILQNIANKLL